MSKLGSLSTNGKVCPAIEAVEEMPNIGIGAKIKYWLDRSLKVQSNLSKFKLADDFAKANTAKVLNNIDPPCGKWGGNAGKLPHSQLDIVKTGGVKHVILDDAIVDLTAIAQDAAGNNIYKAIYHDSKLTSAADWTTNQKSEIINVFSGSNPPAFIEFEVRGSAKYFDDFPNSPIKTGSKIRIYRADVYKSISNGDGLSIIQTIKLF